MPMRGTGRRTNSITSSADPLPGLSLPLTAGGLKSTALPAGRVFSMPGPAPCSSVAPERLPQAICRRCPSSYLRSQSLPSCVTRYGAWHPHRCYCHASIRCGTGFILPPTPQCKSRGPIAKDSFCCKKPCASGGNGGRRGRRFVVHSRSSGPALAVGFHLPARRGEAAGAWHRQRLPVV